MDTFSAAPSIQDFGDYTSVAIQEGSMSALPQGYLPAVPLNYQGHLMRNQQAHLESIDAEDRYYKELEEGRQWRDFLIKEAYRTSPLWGPAAVYAARRVIPRIHVRW